MLEIKNWLSIINTVWLSCDGLDWIMENRGVLDHIDTQDIVLAYTLYDYFFGLYFFGWVQSSLLGAGFL